MKQKQLECFLQQFKTFDKPRLELEQYATGVPLAASILTTIQSTIGFEEALIGDLGCGCGVFMLGALQLGANFAMGFDVDENALKICRENIIDTDLEKYCDLIQTNLVDKSSTAGFEDRFDIIITNPPFGTKNNEGIDIKFVEHGLALLKPGGNLFSLHKSSTRNFILRKAKNDWKNVCTKAECIANLKWNLGKTYRHQKHENVDIAVDLIQFSKVL